MNMGQVFKKVLQLVPNLGPIRAHKITQKYSTMGQLLETIQASRGNNIDYVILQDQKKFQEKLARSEKLKKEMIEVLGKATYYQILDLFGFEME